MAEKRKVKIILVATDTPGMFRSRVEIDGRMSAINDNVLVRQYAEAAAREKAAVTPNDDVTINEEQPENPLDVARSKAVEDARR